MMLFEMTYEEVSSVVGARNVHRLSPEAAQAYGLTGDTADFLVSTGLPSSDSFHFRLPEQFTGEAVHAQRKMTELGWKVPSEVDCWIGLGYFPINQVAVDPADGRVYQFTEGSMTASVIHEDVSSLAMTLTSTMSFLQQYVEVGDDEEAYQDRMASLAKIRQDISERDRKPFENPDSEWGSIFEEIEAGMWT
jgi:hypothetical protein